MVQCPHCEYLCDIHVIISLPLEYTLLRWILFSPAHFNPIRCLQKWVLIFIHEAIDEARSISLRRYLHKLIKEPPLVMGLIFLVNMIDEWKICNVLTNIFSGQTCNISIIRIKLIFSTWVTGWNPTFRLLLQHCNYDYVLMFDTY